MCGGSSGPLLLALAPLLLSLPHHHHHAPHPAHALTPRSQPYLEKAAADKTRYAEEKALYVAWATSHPRAAELLRPAKVAAGL